jgi:hypothetical protein
MKSRSEHVVTANQISSITGVQDDGFVTAILNLGPSQADIIMALQSLENNELKASLSMNSIVQHICEILKAHNDLNELGERL